MFLHNKRLIAIVSVDRKKNNTILSCLYRHSHKGTVKWLNKHNRRPRKHYNNYVTSRKSIIIIGLSIKYKIIKVSDLYISKKDDSSRNVLSVEQSLKLI